MLAIFLFNAFQPTKEKKFNLNDGLISVMPASSVIKYFKAANSNENSEASFLFLSSDKS